MTRTLLIRGMLVGLLAGVLAFVVARLLGEGPLVAGISFESAVTADAHEHVSRTVQSTFGLGTGTLVFGVALGGLYGLGYALAQGRLGALSARATAVLVAAGGFLGVYLLPALKYPANPPGTTNPDTITDRTQWYFLMLLISVVVVAGGTVLARRLSSRLGSWNSTLLAMLAGLIGIVLAYLALPVVDETPKDFSGAELWRFRMASTAIQFTVWATLGVVFGALTERQLRGSQLSAPQDVRSPAGR